MKLFIRCMKEAARFRHAFLVSCLYKADTPAWRRSMDAHMRFVDLVYSPWL